MHTVIPSPSAQSGVPNLRKRSPWFRLPAPSGVLPPWGPRSAKAAWSSGMAAMPGFKSQCQSSSAAPFPTPSIISYTCQHSCLLPALLGCHSKYVQVWPHGTESIFSKPSHRRCNQGELLPSYILGGSHSLLQAQSGRPQLFNISMKPVKGYRYVKWPCQRLLYKTALNGLLHVSLPPAQACGAEDILYIFF